jgi:hypothetical protein
MGSTRNKDEKGTIIALSTTKHNQHGTNKNVPVSFVRYVLLSSPVVQWVNRMPPAVIAVVVIVVVARPYPW